MHGELVSMNTADKLRLHGLYCPTKNPTQVKSEFGSVDAAVLIHGLGGNFYSSRLLQHFASLLNELGISVVLANTRGHEMINTLSWAGRSRSIGAALEDVDHCRFDLNGWADFLVERGHGNVMFFGHSLGAIKSLYAQAHEPHSNIKALVGLSATRLSYSKLIDMPSGDLFRDTFGKCESLVSEGQGDVPIHVPFPFPTWMTPDCYLKKYGPSEQFNWMRFIDKVDIPSLLLFGEKELVTPAFEGLSEELETLKAGWNSLSIQTIESADHFYSGCFDIVDDAITRWLTN